MFKNVTRLLVVLFCLTVSCFVFNIDTEKVSASSFERGVYNGKPYKLYVPSSYDEYVETPLIVMLHGCTQNPDDFAAGTEMNAIAEREGFFVLYPEQPMSANIRHCWNWFETNHQARGIGEPAIIAGMVHKVKNEYSVDEERVYVGGLSAGGAMSVIMGATYPDLFTAIGVVAGLEYKAATNLVEATSAMLNGGPDPTIQGERAFQAMGAYARVVPVIVFHGADDWTVRPINGEQVVKQWIETNNLVYDGEDYISDTPAETIEHEVPNKRNYTQHKYQNTKSQTIIESYIIHGMGHAWPGGSNQGSHTDPLGPNASEIMWNFFKTKTKSGLEDDEEDEKPTTTANPPGGEYVNSVTVELIADREGTTYYTTDGTEPTRDSQVYTEPIFIEESTELKFFTIDQNGNEEDVKTELYTIKREDEEDEKPNTVANPPGGEYVNSVTVELITDRDGTTYYTTDGTEPTKDSQVYTEPIFIEETTELKFFTVDQDGNEEEGKTEIYTIVTEDDEDEEEETDTINIVIESEQSGFVGRLLADGMSTNGLKVGDKGMFNTDTYRTILSFDTSEIGERTVQSVKLVLFTKSITGTIQNISVDSKIGHFGSNPNLERHDFSASATYHSVASNANIPTTNRERFEFEIPVNAINPDGLTQFRLQAKTTAGFYSNLLEIYKHENEDYIPQLEIELK